MTRAVATVLLLLLLASTACVSAPAPADASPRLDLISLAFDDSLSSSARAVILGTIGGVVEHSTRAVGSPPLLLVRIRPAADESALIELLGRLSALPGVFVVSRGDEIATLGLVSEQTPPP